MTVTEDKLNASLASQGREMDGKLASLDKDLTDRISKSRLSSMIIVGGTLAAINLAALLAGYFGFSGRLDEQINVATALLQDATAAKTTWQSWLEKTESDLQTLSVPARVSVLEAALERQTSKVFYAERAEAFPLPDPSSLDRVPHFPVVYNVGWDAEISSASIWKDHSIFVVPENGLYEVRIEYMMQVEDGASRASGHVLAALMIGNTPVFPSYTGRPLIDDHVYSSDFVEGKAGDQWHLEFPSDAPEEIFVRLIKWTIIRLKVE